MQDGPSGPSYVDAASCRIAAATDFRGAIRSSAWIGSPLRGLLVGTDACFHVASGKMPLLCAVRPRITDAPGRADLQITAFEFAPPIADNRISQRHKEHR